MRSPVGDKAVVRSMYSDEADARRYIVEGYVYFALIHAQTALVWFGVLPAWTLAVGLPLWMARMMIGRHELIHLRKESQVDPFTRLWPVLAMVTPLSAGFREYRVHHARHHKYMLTERDPDLYQIRGSMLQGWLQCVTSPEQTLIRWIAEKGLDRALLVEVLARAAFFSTIAVVLGGLFLWYWIPLRLAYGTALFFFSYVLHRRGDRQGVFRIELPRWGELAFIALFGKVGWLAVCNHDLHHANGNVSPLHYGTARDFLAADAQASRAPTAHAA